MLNPFAAPSAVMRQGFTLLELAIVVMVIGLIIGGIVTMRDMSRAAEMNAIAMKIAQYEEAATSFKEIYGYWPGDMPNAEDYWSTATNGDGDDEIQLDSGAPHQEAWDFWLQLGGSGLINGTYTGLPGSIGYADAVANENAPAAPISGHVWAVSYSDAVATADTFSYVFGNHFVFGMEGSDGWPSAASFTPQESYQLDKKIDDGKPAKGRLRAFKWANCTEATARTELDTDYDLSNTEKVCALHWNIDEDFYTWAD